MYVTLPKAFEGYATYCFEMAAERAHVRLHNYRGVTRTGSPLPRRTWGMTLTRIDETWRSLGYSRKSNGERKLGMGVCWHGYGQFMREVFRSHADAIIRTGLNGRIVYRGLSDFFKLASGTGMIDVGSGADPLRMDAKCLCTAPAPWQYEVPWHYGGHAPVEPQSPVEPQWPDVSHRVRRNLV